VADGLKKEEKMANRIILISLVVLLQGCSTMLGSAIASATNFRDSATPDHVQRMTESEPRFHQHKGESPQ
jgi:uncharacterized protein YceK